MSLFTSNKHRRLAQRVTTRTKETLRLRRLSFLPSPFSSRTLNLDLKPSSRVGAGFTIDVSLSLKNHIYIFFFYTGYTLLPSNTINR